MKKFFFPLFFLLFTILLIFPKKSFAYTENEEVCYSQCSAYKFVWQGDYCYDLFQEQCAIGSGNTIKETIKFLKSIYGVLKDGSGVENVFKAWFVCKPLIENCIVPQLQACRSTCSQDQLFYAPDISVGHPYGNFVYHGVIYNDQNKTLTFKVVNNGRGYAWDIGASASWGHTRNRDGLVSGGGQLFSENIPELIYFGARNGPPKTASDYVTDFLIEESNFAKYLQGFKSDADNYNVPVIWLKTIPFTATEGELTKVIFNVDPNQMITESSEQNNTFILTIDKLPTPPFFQINNFSQKLENNTLNNFLIEFNIKNSGEENGQATVKIFEDKFNGTNTQTSIYSSTQTVQGLNKFNFSTFIAPDITDSGAYCGKTKRYELVVFDDKGKVDSHQFSLPLYFGSVNGRVEDLFGKKIEGATITASTGQTATVDNYGWYHLKNVNQLGKITLTATHPEFSKIETKELEFKIKDINDPCSEGSLTFNNIDFVLKDQEVLFTITIKDSSGALVTAQVLATNKDWRFNETVNGNGPLPGTQPGQYTFTLSAPGYKTISQDVNAVPNNQNLEFTMEKLGGRLTDGGLTIHEPRLLWQMDRGAEIVANVTASKDGKLVVLYTSRNKLDAGKLYFLDNLTGNQRKAFSTIATGGQSQTSLDCSYDGNTTALYVHHGTFGTTKNSQNVLKLFNSQGNSIGEKILDSQSSAHLCEVSPDGFYIYPYQLMNKGLYEYTRFDIEGRENSEAHATYVANQVLHFTTANNIVAGCPKGGGQCVETVHKGVVNNLGDIDGFTVGIDSSQAGSNIAMLSNDKAYLFGNGAKLWEKEVITHGDTNTISISPGGKFVIYTTVPETYPHRTIKIFTDNNIEKTPLSLPSPGKEDVLFVHANDKGIFFMTNQQKTIKYYQVGSYSVEYNPTIAPPTGISQQTTNNISFYENGVWQPMGTVNFYQLLPGKIYLANTNITLQLMDIGSLKILEGTLFGTDNYLHPILLKGQMTADFASPISIYAIKFDRYDLDLFQTKLDQFRQGNLPENEYFTIKNIHTKFTIKNQPNDFKVSVENGTVNVLADKTEKVINSGKQITIDASNNIKESNFFNTKIYIITFGILILILGIVLFIYRKTKLGGGIIKILKKIVVFVWKMIRKSAPVLFNWLKLFFQFLIKQIKKLLKIKKIILVLFLSLFLTGCSKKPGQENQQTVTLKTEVTQPLQNNEITNEKIIPSSNLCSQISKEFVTQATGIIIERISSINDSSINACDYYLTNDNNSPYIAIIVNKNLNFEKNKQIALKNKFVIKEDPNISVNHYIAWADNETRISNINLFLDENSFLRIDKNVERAIDNSAMTKLAIEISKRL